VIRDKIARKVGIQYKEQLLSWEVIEYTNPESMEHLLYIPHKMVCEKNKLPIQNKMLIHQTYALSILLYFLVVRHKLPCLVLEDNTGLKCNYDQNFMTHLSHISILYSYQLWLSLLLSIKLSLDQAKLKCWTLKKEN